MKPIKYLPRLKGKTNPEINRRGIVAVYFLINKGRVIYVGKTTNLKSRICTHKSYANFYFEYFRFIECDLVRLDRTEKRCIKRFMPILNGMLPDGTRKRIEYEKNDVPDYVYAHQEPTFYQIHQNFVWK